MNDVKNYFSQFTSVLKNMSPEESARYDAEIKRLEAEQAASAKIERYRKSGAPERYWDESLDTYKTETDEQKNILAIVRGFLKSIMQFCFRTLVLLGKAGTGKTHLACGLVREFGGKYRTAPEIVEELRRAKSFSANETEAEILDYYGRVPLLVIDEIGRGINAVDEKYMIYQIINARYNTRRPTVLISNHNKAEFLQCIGVAAADRLVESAEIKELKGESYRRELRQ